MAISFGRAVNGFSRLRERKLILPSIGEATFLVAALAPVLALLTLPIPVLDDGGLHLGSASALQYLLAGDFPEMLEWRPGAPPNVVADLVLLVLLQVLPSIWALKVLVAAILLGFAFAARQVAVATGVAAPWATMLLPFAWHRPLAMGFLGFSAAVALALVAISLVLRCPTRPPARPLAALLAVTWLTHLVPALIGTAVCFAVVVAGTVASRQSGAELRLRRPLRDMVLASIPVLLLTLTFTALNPPGSAAVQPGSVARRIVSVVGMIKADVSSVPAEYAIYGLAAAILYVLTGAILLVRLRGGWRVRPVDALLVSALFGFVAAVLLPDAISGGGSYLGLRIALFPPLLLAAWVAAHLGSNELPLGRTQVTAVVALMGIFSLLLVAVRLPAQRANAALAVETRELARCLPERSTVIQLRLDNLRAVAEQTNPLSNQVGLFATDRKSLDVGNESGWVPYYLWRYRENQSADRVLATKPYGATSSPPRVDLAGALRKGVRLDGILLIGRSSAPPAVLDDGPTHQILADLEANYERVATSSRGGFELWLRTGMSDTCG